MLTLHLFKKKYFKVEYFFLMISKLLKEQKGEQSDLTYHSRLVAAREIQARYEDFYHFVWLSTGNLKILDWTRP